MADHKNKADFNAMSVTLKNIYKNGGFQGAETWKPRSFRSRKNGSASGSKFRKGDSTAFDEYVDTRLKYY